jgi:hypothetical protein
MASRYIRLPQDQWSAGRDDGLVLRSGQRGRRTMAELDGKIALLTGAGAWIGGALARLADELPLFNAARRSAAPSLEASAPALLHEVQPGELSLGAALDLLKAPAAEWWPRPSGHGETRSHGSAAHQVASPARQKLDIILQSFAGIAGRIG